jgi:hypothetical protein
MQRLLVAALILLYPLSATAEELFFWDGTIGAAKIRLFLVGREYAENHKLAFNDDPKFFARHKDSIWGFYQYDKYKAELSVIGTTQDGNWKFEEHTGSICTNCKPNGYFDGHQTGDTVTGFWTSGDSSKRLPFRIEKQRLSKKTVFGWLRGGEWALERAEGQYGANAMTSLWKDAKGRWKAGGSAITQAMREGYGLDVSKDEKRLLSGLRIFVTDSLDVVVNSDAEELLRIPYSDEPLFALDEITPETDGIGRIHAYRDKPGLTIARLTIATTDRGKLADVLKVEALPFDTPAAVHIEYGISADTFAVSLISGDCCASQELVFKRIRPSGKNKAINASRAATP